MFKGKFIDNLPKIYGTYTGGFIVFIILMAIAEQAGMSAKLIGIFFVAFTVLIYALIGYLSRTMQTDAYYVAGRQVPTVFNGMATAADWMSGASFVAMAGGIYFKGYGYMALLVGWTGGYVLVASLLAPYLRKFGCYTVPDFIGTRSIDLYFPSRKIDINGSIFLKLGLSSSIMWPSFVFLTLKYSALLSLGQITNGTLSTTSIP